MMLRSAIIICCFMLVSFGVQAAEGDAAVMNADPARSITTLCQQLTTYQPRDDVTYVPGKDVRGKAVIPADLDGGSPNIEVQYPLQIAITMDQARQFNLLPNTGNTYTPQMFIGMVELRKDGSVYFNGKRLSQPQVQFLCTE